VFNVFLLKKFSEKKKKENMYQHTLPEFNFPQHQIQSQLKLTKIAVACVGRVQTFPSPNSGYLPLRHIPHVKSICGKQTLLKMLICCCTCVYELNEKNFHNSNSKKRVYKSKKFIFSSLFVFDPFSRLAKARFDMQFKIENAFFCI
jgi:hypothetical protein